MSDKFDLNLPSWLEDDDPDAPTRYLHFSEPPHDLGYSGFLDSDDASVDDEDQYDDADDFDESDDFDDADYYDESDDYDDSENDGETGDADAATVGGDALLSVLATATGSGGSVEMLDPEDIQPHDSAQGNARPAVAILLALLMLFVVGEVTVRIWAAVVDPQEVRWYDAATQVRAERLSDVAPRSVVFAGTSMAWQGFVPATFAAADPQGRTAWNAGLAGGVPVVTEPWLRDHVIPELQPELVVWGLSSLDFSSSYGDASEEAWANAPETKTGLLASIDRASSVSALLKWRSVLRSPSAWAGSRADDVAQDFETAAAILGPDGERADFTPDLSDEHAAIHSARVSDMTPDVEDVAAVIRTIEDLRDRGVEVVLVQMPVPPRFVELHPAGAASLEQVRNLIAGIGTETNVQVVDLGAGFTDANFVDFSHLDDVSRTRLTEQLATSLAPG